MFSTLPKTNFNFSVTFILSPAYAFKLDQSEILLFGKELSVTQNLKSVSERVENIVEKEKGENARLPAFSLFPTIISESFFLKVI